MSQFPSVNVVDPITPGASAATQVASYGAKTALDAAVTQQVSADQIAAEERMEAGRREDMQWAQQQQAQLAGLQAQQELARLRAMRAKGELLAPAIVEYGRRQQENAKSARALMAAMAAKEGAQGDKVQAIKQMRDSAAAHAAAKRAHANLVADQMLSAATDELLTGGADRFSLGFDNTGSPTPPAAIFDTVLRRAQGKGERFLEDEGLTGVSTLLGKAWTAVQDDGILDDTEAKAVLMEASKVTETAQPEQLKGVLMGLRRMAKAIRQAPSGLAPGDRKTEGLVKARDSAASKLEEMVSKLEVAADLDDETVFDDDLKFVGEMEKALALAEPAAFAQMEGMKGGVPEHLKNHFESVMGAMRTGMDQEKAIGSLDVIFHDQMNRMEEVLLKAVQEGDAKTAEELAPVMESMIRYFEETAGGR